MVALYKNNERSSLIDRLYAYWIIVIQNTLVKINVIKDRKRKFIERKSYLTHDSEYVNRLKKLGLVTERLWWGPMTLNPSKINYLLNEIERRPPRRVLEIGSGSSTAVLAAAGEMFGFDVYSLENHPGTIRYVQSILDGLLCDRRVTIQLCEFIQKRYPDGTRYRWYNADLKSAKGLFDFVIIDGPISFPIGRNGALPEILPFLSDDHRIYVDDAKRPHEKKCLVEWTKMYPGIQVTMCTDAPGMVCVKVPEKYLHAKVVSLN